MSLYRLPEGFEDRLNDKFAGKYRLRWSNEWDEWQLEQKVRRGLAGRPTEYKHWKDDFIRERDGYVWVMSIKQGTRFPCRRCGAELKAPLRLTEMVKCQWCDLKGYQGHTPASYWPMDDTFLDYIDRMEKELDGTIKAIQAKDRLIEQKRIREVLDPTLDGFQDRFNQGMGIQSVGYTGKEFK